MDAILRFLPPDHGVPPGDMAHAVAKLDHAPAFVDSLRSAFEAGKQGERYCPQAWDAPARHQWVLTRLHQSAWRHGIEHSPVPVGNPQTPIPIRLLLRRRRWDRAARDQRKASAMERDLSEDDIAQALHLVAEAASRAGVSYALTGGVLMRRLGTRRTTTDVDFIATGPLEFPSEQSLTFGGERYRLPNSTPVDWIQRNDEYRELYDEALVHAVRDEQGMPVVAAEYLAAMKLAARRAKDQDDLIVLINSGRLDLDRTREIVRRLVGGRFAVDEFDAFVLEAHWRASEELG